MNFRRVIRFFQRFLPLLTIFILISGSLAGCRFPWQREEEPEVEEEQHKETEEEGLSSSEPRQDLPPALVEVFPLPGSSIALKQPITIYFNQPMDKESVEAAIHFEPGISGRFSWQGERIITFTPDQSITPGSSLHMVVKTSAQAANEKSLRSEIELDFHTADPLQVMQVVPGDGTQEVNPETAVFVAFNQPVVGLGQSTDADPAFSISPEVPGTGEWLNTSTFIFRPEPSMEGGTVYTITLNEDLIATSGAGMETSAQMLYFFSTTQPYVLDVYPRSDETLSIDGPVEMKFNIRMDPESVEDHFQLVSVEGTEVEGGFEWDEDYRKLTFTPDENLERDSTYTIRLAAGSESFGGSIIDTPLEISSETYPQFSVDPQTAPQYRNFHGQYGQYAITFTTPLKSTKYKTAVSISPEASGQIVHVNTNNTKLNLTGYYEPETEYTVTLDADLEDRWGAQLGNEVTYTFTTPPAEPMLNIAAGYSGNGLVFVPASASEIVFQATNINTVTTELSPISMDDLITILHPDNYIYRQAYLPETLETKVHNLDLVRNLSEVVRIPLSFEGDSLSPGIYFLRVSSQDIIDESDRAEELFLVVSENNLVMKTSSEQALVWGTSLEDYSPLSNAPISIYTTEGQLVTSGELDTAGLFQSSFEQVDEPYSQFIAQVGEPGQDNFAFSISSWGASRLWEMGIRYTSMPATLDGYVYTDRPIYRPGDTVYFKALIFSRENGIPVPHDLDHVNISIFSSGGLAGEPDQIYSNDLVPNHSAQ